MLNDWSSLLTEEGFARALKTDPGLFEFGVEIAVATAQHVTRMKDQDRASTQAQATASKLLLSDLDQTNEALAKCTQCIKALESELAASKIENEELGTKAASCISELESGSATIGLLQSDLEKATKGRDLAERRATELEMKAIKLEEESRRSKEWTQKYHENINTVRTKLQAKEDELKKETVRANSI